VRRRQYFLLYRRDLLKVMCNVSFHSVSTIDENPPRVNRNTDPQRDAVPTGNANSELDKHYRRLPPRSELHDRRNSYYFEERLQRELDKYVP
jgi:hypothetical protein